MLKTKESSSVNASQTATHRESGAHQAAFSWNTFDAEGSAQILDAFTHAGNPHRELRRRPDGNRLQAAALIGNLQHDGFALPE